MSEQECEILSIWFPVAVAERREIAGAKRNEACDRMRDRHRRDFGREPTGEAAHALDE